MTIVPAAPSSLRTQEGRYKAAKVVCNRAAILLSIHGWLCVISTEAMGIRGVHRKVVST